MVAENKHLYLFIYIYTYQSWKDPGKWWSPRLLFSCEATWSNWSWLPLELVIQPGLGSDVEARSCIGLVCTHPTSRVVRLHMKHQDQRRLSNDGKRWVTHWVFEIGFSRFQLLKPSCRFTPAGQVSLHFQSFQKSIFVCHVVRDVPEVALCFA